MTGVLVVIGSNKGLNQCYIMGNRSMIRKNINTEITFIKCIRLRNKKCSDNWTVKRIFEKINK